MNMFMDLENENAINNIRYAKALYDSQVEKVKKEKYIRDVLKNNYVMVVRSHKSKYDYMSSTFNNARKQFDKKLKKERQELETLTEIILEDFLNNDHNFKLKSIISCGYENYGWELEFEGYEQTFRIIIPVKANIDTSNIGYAYDGMFAFSVNTSGAYWSVRKQSHKPEDIAEFIKGYFKLDDSKEE